MPVCNWYYRVYNEPIIALGNCGIRLWDGKKFVRTLAFFSFFFFSSFFFSGSVERAINLPGFGISKLITRIYKDALILVIVHI